MSNFFTAVKLLWQKKVCVLYYMYMENIDIEQLLYSAVEKRQAFLQADPLHRGAWRIFNGFTEGCSDLAIDLMGRTAVVHDYGKSSAVDGHLIGDFLVKNLDFLQAVLLKKRNYADGKERNGMLIYGEKTDSFIEEHNVRYSVDLTMNHDNGFYADTRNLRKYLLDNMQGKSVLNTFAYTGSLGVAAAAGGRGPREEPRPQENGSGKFLDTLPAEPVKFYRPICQINFCKQLTAVLRSTA